MILTQSTIEAIDLVPGQSERIVFDERLPGFGLRIRRGGQRTWIIQYRVGRKQHRKTLGPVHLILAGRAYAAAEQDLSAIESGRQPREDIQVRQYSTTLLCFLDRFLRFKSAQLKASSYTQLEAHLTKHWEPLHDLSIAGIARDDVTRQLAKLSVEHGPCAANRARSSLSSFFNWAVAEGLIEANPVTGTKAVANETARDRVLSDCELATIWKACREDDYGAIIRLLILTGQRREDIGAMASSEIDTEARRWIIPGNRTRLGLVHEVPLCDLALSTVEHAIARVGQGRMFGREKVGNGFSGWSKAKAALDQRIATMTGATPYWEIRGPTQLGAGPDDYLDMTLTDSWAWRIQDIRRTIEVRMLELAILPHAIDAVLNRVSKHRSLGHAINRSDHSVDKRHALELWASHVIALLANDNGDRPEIAHP
jgi:integrase